MFANLKKNRFPELSGGQEGTGCCGVGRARPARLPQRRCAARGLRRAQETVAPAAARTAMSVLLLQPALEEKALCSARTDAFSALVLALKSSETQRA